MGDIAGYFTVIPLDWFILGGIAILIALDALRSGLGRANALAIAFPVALFLFSLLSKAALISTIGLHSDSAVTQALTYGVLLSLTYLFIRRMGLDYIDSGIGEPIQAMLGGVAVAVIVTVIWLHTPALDSLWQLNVHLKAIFAESFRLWWLLGAYAALAFARG